MSPKYLIYISIFLLSGCGEGNNGYGWEYDYKYKDMRIRGESKITPDEMLSEYEKAVQCFGEKYPPFIIFVPEVINNEACGKAYANPPLIVISTNEICLESDSLPKELVHYFVEMKHGQEYQDKLSCIN